MSEHDIVKENDNYRVYLEIDDSGEKPYDEGATPILSMPFRRGSGARFEAVNDAGEGFEYALTELYQRFDNFEEAITRYLRIFHGAYSVVWDSSEDNRYVSFDTAAWREKVGLSDEWLDAHTLERETLAEGSLSEIISWANGDIYGWVVEKRVRVVSTRTDYSGDGERTEEHDDWDVVDSCWGFFGREYAEEAATEAFDTYGE